MTVAIRVMSRLELWPRPGLQVKFAGETVALRLSGAVTVPVTPAGAIIESSSLTGAAAAARRARPGACERGTHDSGPSGAATDSEPQSEPEPAADGAASVGSESSDQGRRRPGYSSDPGRRAAAAAGRRTLT